MIYIKEGNILEAEYYIQKALGMGDPDAMLHIELLDEYKKSQKY